MCSRGPRHHGQGTAQVRRARCWAIETASFTPVSKPKRPQTGTTKNNWRDFALVALAGVVTRLLFLFSQQGHRGLFSVLYHGDTSAYLGFAASFLGKTPYDQGIPFHPPGYPFLLSILLRLSGFSPGAEAPPALLLRVFMTVLGGLTCGFFFLLIRRIFGRAVALASLPLALFSFGHYVQSTAINSEGWFLLLSLAVTFGLVRLAEMLDRERPPRGRAARGVGLGLLLGVLAAWATLTRAEFLLTAGLLAALLLLVAGRRAWAPAAAFVFAVLVTMTPWTVRCYHSIGLVNQVHAERLPRPLPRLVLVTGYGPLNFATANNSFAKGSFDTGLIDALVPGRRDRSLDLADPGINRLYIDGYRVGLTWMAEHPAEAVALIARKVSLAAQALALGYLQVNLPAGLTGQRRPVDQFVPSALWFAWIQGGLMLLGLWRLIRGPLRQRPERKRTVERARAAPRSKPLWLFLVPHALTTTVVIVAFFGYARLGMLLAPVIWLLVGSGLLALVEVVPWPSSWRRRPAHSLVLLILVLLAVEVVLTSTGPRSYAVTGSRIPGTQQINPDDLLMIRPSRR